MPKLGERNLTLRTFRGAVREGRRALWVGLLAMLLTASLASCGEPDEGQTSPPTPAPTSTVAPTATSAPTSTRAPTAMPAPSPTSTPTATPAPTPTPKPPVSLSEFENGAQVERELPTLASFIKDLPWIQDGVGNSEPIALESILSLAMADSSVTGEIVWMGWAQDGMDELEIGVVEALVSMVDYDRETPSFIVSMGWFQDGIEDAEAQAIQGLASTVENNVETALAAVFTTWIQDGIDDTEASAIEGLASIVDGDVNTALSIVYAQWFEDGIEDSEAQFINDLSHIADGLGSLPWYTEGPDDYASWALYELRQLLTSGQDFDAALIGRVVHAGWFIDGIEEDPINHSEASAIRTLSAVALEEGELSTALAGLGWAFDKDMTRAESDSIWAAKEMETLVEGTGVWLAGLPWMEDDLTEHDFNAAFRLWDILKIAAEMDRDFFGFLDLVIETEHDQMRVLDVHVMNTLYLLYSGRADQGLTQEFRSERAELFNKVVSAPWFNDGLNDEERVRIISFWYDDLLGPHFVQSKTIDLPLAGEVNLWVLQHESIPGYEDVMRMAEEAVRGTERLLGVPFPTSEVILAVVRREGDLGWRCYSGVAYDDRVEVGDWLDDGPYLRRVVYHEIAHYYFKGGIGPGWVLEGGSDYAAWRIDDWLGYSSLKDAREHAEEYRALCVEQGMTNLQMLSTHEPTEEYAKLSFSCRYPMGMDFLLRLQQIIGDEAMSAIFRELYRTIHLRFGTGYYLGGKRPAGLRGSPGTHASR